MNMAAKISRDLRVRRTAPHAEHPSAAVVCALICRAMARKQGVRQVRKAGVLTALFAVCCLGGAVAGDAAAAVGDLTQKAGPAGCISELGTAPCADATAVSGAFSVTVSPDGTSTYVASATSNAIAVFNRGADGTLTQKGCLSDTGAGPCVDATALAGAASVAVSPDGKNAYAASATSSAVAVFDRGADGTLTQRIGTAACISDAGAPPCFDATALAQPISVTLSPDGKSAYVASSVSDAVAVFDRAADGTLTQKPGPAGCIAETAAAGCTDGTGLDGARSVTVSADGKNAYAASDASDAVAVFDRAADGTLTQKPGPAGCIAETAAAGCTDGTGLDGARSVTVSADGKNAYAASATSNAVAVFDRAADGTLTQKPGPAGCIAETAAAGCADGAALVIASSVTVSPDGRSAYAASAGSAAVAAFDRAADGTLTQKPGPAGCIAETAAAGCADGAGLGGAAAVTVSSDGRSAYAASPAGNAVAVFDRETPSVSPVPPAAPAPPQARAPAVPLPLACSGRSIALLDVHRAGRRVEVSGVALPLLRGRRASIRSLVKGSRAVSATIQADGSFRTTVPLPPRNRRATVRYQATIAGRRSASLRLVRQLTIVSRRTTSAGTRITARLSNPRGRRRITIDRQLTCTTYRRLRTVRTNRAGRFTITLPAPRAPELIAYYRATTQRSRGRGRSYSLPVAVRATTPR
jgi:DNA-binding beta-propeller fold protein YncE